MGWNLIWNVKPCLSGIEDFSLTSLVTDTLSVHGKSVQDESVVVLTDFSQV